MHAMIGLNDLLSTFLNRPQLYIGDLTLFVNNV